MARYTRPDIASAVHRPMRRSISHECTIINFKAHCAIHLGTRGYKLRMTPTDKADYKSLTGEVILLNGMAVS